MTSRETSIVEGICRVLKTLPSCWYLKIHGSPMQRSGIPDIIGCYLGSFFWLEVKRPGEKATPLQVRVHGHIRRADGTMGGVVDSVADAKDILGLD